MKRTEAEGLFVLAGFEPLAFFELADGYVPTRGWPWWLVKTAHGLIRVGWRKRVIHIEWDDTPARLVVTADEVTKDTQMVHAYSYAKAVEYLTTLRRALDKLAEPVEAKEPPNDPA